MIFAISFTFCSGATAKEYPDKECLSCHSAQIKSKKLDHAIAPISSETFKGTPHEKKMCVDCHSTARLADKPKKHMAAISSVECSQCHYKGNKNDAPNLDISKDYYNGIHGRKLKNGKTNPDTPQCKDCHGFHEIRFVKDPRSSTNRLNEPVTCEKCHGNNALMKKYNITSGMLGKYKKSIHGVALLKKGINVSAVCSDCHGAHNIMPSIEKKSLTNRANLPGVCATCHEGTFLIYEGSIHGEQWAKGNKDVPICTDCHSTHDILTIQNKSAKAGARNIVKTCTHCHNNSIIARKYNVPLNRLDSFENSFHGTALKLNNLKVANCASCHGSHGILPSRDPNSSINKRNLAKTCGKCHPDAKKNKNIGKVHTDSKEKGMNVLFILRTVYILMISGTMAGIMFYIFTDIYGNIRRKRGKDSGGSDE